jgi:hypothetical protein
MTAAFSVSEQLPEDGRNTLQLNVILMKFYNKGETLYGLCSIRDGNE